MKTRLIFCRFYGMIVEAVYLGADSQGRGLWSTDGEAEYGMLDEIVEPLEVWYRKEKRTLPWREQRNPYYIWVSEIMLQQTRVEAVKPYFQRFIRELPDVKALAVCPEEKLLKLWEGLGYYNRVRNMQKAARIVMEQYGGVLPADAEALKRLPGIGSYTAGAVASIAYGIPVPAVDGNVLRVLARFREDSRDMTKQSVRKSVEADLSAVMPEKSPGEFNQALMEVGAVICVPGGMARCRECPLARMCRAHASGREQCYPVKAEKKPRRIEEKTVLVIRDGERFALRKRPGRGLLAGLYEFPNLEGHRSPDEVIRWVEEAGLTPLHIQKLDDAKHIFSHVEWHMSGYAVRAASLEAAGKGALILVDIKEAREKYPVPSAFSAYADYLNLSLGTEKDEQRIKK